MGMLADLMREPWGGGAFHKARHAIGRLAAYVRAVRQLLVDSRHLEDLLDVFEVAAIPRPPCVPRPEADGLTNLNGVLRRMLAINDARFPRFFAYLSDMDEQTGLEDELLKYYHSNKHAPCVHTEIQTLHHFYDRDLTFVGGDTYIAISKPACLACKVYFRHHPAGYEEPDSHEKIYPNWSPIFMANGQNEPGWIEHRNFLNNVIQDLRKEVLKEIERRRSISLQHQDTLTGLTPSDHILGDGSSDSQDSEKTGGTGGTSACISDFDTGSEGGVAI